MENMSIFAPPYASNFENLIRIEGLDKLDDLMSASTFEEVPIYSRYSHIKFLNNESVADRNRILVRSAAAYLRVIVDYSKDYYRNHAYDYYCMVSITDWERIDEGKEPIDSNFWYTNPSRGVLDLIPMWPVRSKQGLYVENTLAGSEIYEVNENIERCEDGNMTGRIYIRFRPDKY